MAEVEYEGIKMSGSKMLFILPLLGTLIGGLWGGFELYSRLLEAEVTLANLKPEAIQAELVRLTELTEIIKTDLREDINAAREDINTAKGDINIVREETGEEIVGDYLKEFHSEDIHMDYAKELKEGEA